MTPRTAKAKEPEAPANDGVAHEDDDKVILHEPLTVGQGTIKDGCNAAAKILRVIAEVREVKKRGRNTQQNYDYVRDVDVMAAIRAAMVRNRLSITSSLVQMERYDAGRTSNGKPIVGCTVQIAFRFICIDTGDFLEGVWFGDDMDMAGKHLNKAITNGYKTLLIKTFLLPSEFDPEAATIDAFAADAITASQADKPMVEQSASEEMISPDQRRQIVALASQCGLTRDETVGVLRQAVGVSTTTRLPVSRFEDALAAVRKAAQEKHGGDSDA